MTAPHDTDPRIACFISPHGFGHAARASAVMSALHCLAPRIHFDIFAGTPRWFFDRSVKAPFSYHAVCTDIGMIQPSPLHEDLKKTIEHLERFIPFDAQLIDRLSRIIMRRRCRLVICDIAPLGIAVARRSGIPSVLIENFTWDWIYKAYARKDPRFEPYQRYLSETFRQADVHIQTEPLCRRAPGADIIVGPISRRSRTSARDMRERMGVPESARLVLITMGGFKTSYAFRDALGRHRDTWFILPGAGRRPAASPNVIPLPQDSPYFHPDLVHCCDVVAAKAGYSTVAEACHAGAAFACVLRPDFPEARVLEAYIHRHLNSFAMTEAKFQSGEWITQGLPDLLERPRKRQAPSEGDRRAAAVIHALLSA